MNKNLLKVALAQISPVWLNKEKTIEKIKKSIVGAAKENCELIVFGEALLPGYPFWLSLIGWRHNSWVWYSIIMLLMMDDNG